MIPRIVKVQTDIPCPAGAYRLGMETLARLIAQSVRQDQEKQRQVKAEKKQPQAG